MRVAILGAGAIGSAVAVLLTRTGSDVTLIARPDQAAAIRARGLRMDGSLGTITVPVAAAESLDFRPDLALLAVKTQDVEGAVVAQRSQLDGSPLVTLQNGVRSDRIVARLLPREQLLSAVVQITATYLTPGTVTLVDRGHLILGRPDGPRDALVDRVAAILGPAVPTSVSDHLVGAHWLKLLVNLNNALPALTNLSLREVSGDPFLRRLAVLLMREGMRVVDRAGIRLAPLDGVAVRTVRLLTRLPTSMAARMFASRAGALGGEWPILGSTLQSLRRGKPTEIEFLNGEVVDLGRGLGIPTPWNVKVVELVHQIERSGQFLSTDRLREELTSLSAA